MGKLCGHVAGIGGATDEQPAVDGGRLGLRSDAVGLGEPIPEALEGSRRVPASPGRGQRDQKQPVHVLVEWPLHRQRLQQRKCLVGQPVGHQGTSEVPHQAGSDRVQPVAVRRRPVLIEVLGQQLTRPQRERMANVLGRTSRGSPHGRGVEVIDVDDHAALATEDDDLIVENQVLGAHNPASRMQRLMEVVRTHRRVGLRPQLLDEDITMNPMARCERQHLDDRPCLPQPPPWRRRGALDAHREPAQQGDPHGPARVAHPRMLPAPIHAGNHNPSDPDRAGRPTPSISARPLAATACS